jgi:phosphate transport system substrate-binding protein
VGEDRVVRPRVAQRQRRRFARRLTLALVLVVSGLSLEAVGTSTAGGETLQGSGSTLVAPLLAVWNADYSAKAGTSISYLAYGSTAGIAAITNRVVDFGASDAPLTPDQFAAAKGVVQIPWALSATVLSYQISGVTGGLRLDSSAIAGIYLGTIGYWDDSSIAALNPRLTLPHEQIHPVYRSDGSGDTFAFTSFLAKTSADWKSKVGAGTLVRFPAGQGATGNSEVAAAIQAAPGSIGYVSVAYALGNHLPMAAIQNEAGRFATPGIRGIAAAASTTTRVPATNAVSIVDPPASSTIAYPISTFTYVIVPKQTSKATALRKFIFYGLTAGQPLGKKLGFAPIPKVVLVAAEKTLTQIRTGGI